MGPPRERDGELFAIEYRQVEHGLQWGRRVNATERSLPAPATRGADCFNGAAA